MGKIVALIVIALLVAVGIGGCNGYNRLVTLDESVSAAWSQVENVYQRRADLIPNLVETVKGAADFERGTLTDVIEARAKATQITIDKSVLEDPALFAKYQQVQGELSGALARLLVAVERYPDLKANQNFLTLQSQLEGTENRIAVERRKFNEVARGYNTQVRRFPTNLLAGVTGFGARPYFEADPEAEKAPKVEF
jgi:LemA protein